MVQQLLFRTAEELHRAAPAVVRVTPCVPQPLRVGELPTLLTFYIGAITFGMARAFGWATMVRLCNPFRRGRHS
jgi:hypothetical protein